MFKILIGVIIAAIGTLITFMVIDPNISISNNDSSSSSSSSEVQDGYFSVTIEGEVSKPGSYTLAEGSTMDDLIDAAGGITDYTDELAYFTTADLEGGQTYYIPSKYDTTNICSLVEITKVNINEDSADKLLTVNAFTTSVANSIVSYRAEHGDFMTIESIQDVYGIGAATYRKLRNYIILHE